MTPTLEPHPATRPHEVGWLGSGPPWNRRYRAHCNTCSHTGPARVRRDDAARDAEAHARDTTPPPDQGLTLTDYAIAALTAAVTAAGAVVTLTYGSP